MLEQSGYEVETAEDGLKAVEIFTERPDHFDVVLLDVTMPGMDGEQTFRALLEIRDDIPVIVASGYSEQSTMDRFGGPGPVGFLQKPYRAAQLLEMVQRIAAG
jgi:CheY-like chemotaxis protein